MQANLIISVEDVRGRLSLPNIPEINDAIERALTACYVFFNAVLGTTFEPQAGLVDTFYLDPDRNVAQPNRMFRLRLKQAFLKPSSAVLVYAGSRGELATAPVALPSMDYKLDEDKGLLYIDAVDDCASFDSAVLAFSAGDYRRKYVQVTYTAGFDSTDLVTGVLPPQWLKEAMLAWLPSALLTKSDDVQKQLTTAVEIRKLAAAMVEPFKRESALAYHPIY